jgi:hypothetical protein
MSVPGVIVLLDRLQHVFRPGERLTGRYQVVGVGPADLKAVEVCVHWFTDGKGNADVGVHHYEKRGDDDLGTAPEGTFAATLPEGPWSYDGLVVKVVWCVQVRATPRAGEPAEGIAYFGLGTADRAVEALP